MKTTAATLVLAAAFGAAAAAFGSPSLYVPGVALAVLVAALWVWVRSAAGRIRIESLPGPWSLTEGDAYPLGIRIASNPLLPGSTLEHPLADRPLATGSRPGGEHLIALRLGRRGRRLLDPPTLLVSDPFGLQRRRVRAGEGIPVLVLPRIEAVAIPSGAGTGAEKLFGAAAQGSGGAGLDARGVDFEIDGVRPFREGTPASRIHWPTVARSGELVERRLISGGDSPPLVVLDASDPASEESLDQAVRAAASICAHLADNGGCSLLLPGEPLALRVHSRRRGWPEAHAKLALVEPCRGPSTPLLLRGAETVFIASASPAPSFPALPASARLCLLTPEPVAGMRTLFTVSGCHAQMPAPGTPVELEAV